MLARRLAPNYVYPPAFVPPSVVIPAAPLPSLSAPYVEYPATSPAFVQFPTAYEQSPSGFVGYGYAAALPPAMSTAPPGPAFVQYPPPPLPDRMQ